MANNLTQVVYLEQYIESTYFVPTELSRIINTIKALDDKCCDLSEVLHERTATLLSIPPAYQVPPGPEFPELMKKVDADQKMLRQFSEEKVQLAQQAYDLLEMHALELERTLENFESDLRLQDPEQFNALDGVGSDFNYAAAMALESARGRTPKLEDWNLATPSDAYNSIPLPMAPGSVPQTPAPAPLPPAPTPGASQAQKRGSSSASGAGRSVPQKRLRSEDPSFPAPAPQPPTPAGAPAPVAPPPIVPPPGPPVPGPPSSSGPSSHKKRLHSSGSLIAPVGSLSDDPLFGSSAGDVMFEAPPPAQVSSAQIGGTQARSRQVGGLGATWGEAGDKAPPQLGVGFLMPPHPSLKSSANRPQVPGSVLNQQDIGPGLRGRHAELYWPDDASWYLIEIQDVNPITKRARIVYTTGEVEELDLEEISKDRHMTLIPPEFYGMTS